MSREHLYVWPVTIAIGFIFIASNFIWLIPFIADVHEGAARYQTEVARRIAAQADFFLEKRLREIGELALTIVEAGGDPKKADSIIAAFRARHGDFLSIALAPVAILPDEYTVSPIGFLGGRKAITITTPLPYTDFEINAAVAVDEATAVAARESTGGSGRIYIIDAKGGIVFHPHEDRVTSEAIMARPFIAAGGGIGTYVNEQGEEIFAAAVSAPGIGWIVVFENPVSVAWTNKYKAIRLAIVFIIMGALFIAILFVNFKKVMGIAMRERQLREIKTEYISLLAHQLRTPLSATKWNLKTLLDGDWGLMNAKQKTFVMRSYETNEQMIALVRDLLNVTRIEEGKYDFIFKKIDIGAFLARVVGEFRVAAREAGIGLTLKKPPSGTRMPLVRIDEEKMTMAIGNLIDNAIRYNQPEGKIEIGYERIGKELKIYVKDTGVGIPRRDQHRLFTKFFRGDNVVKMQVQGFGLGLYIVKNIIERHGGSIAVKSKENKGTLFTISLPVRYT